MTQRYASIDAYLDTFPPDIRDRLVDLRTRIRTVAPDATEAIRYHLPTFLLEGRHLIAFAGWKSYASLYPVPSGPPAFEDRIAPYRAERSTIRFPYRSPVPDGLVEAIVERRIAEMGAGPGSG